ncbi:hypothetical protein CM240_2163 [Clostridium bornimense]|uniref:Uncharacterized protein n=1 Tax=Clostridium bornimense TaxID=1216932 RepID=W6SHX0_9CLOT|nr:hypothetical protein CM240_2163 [Clostridium bornimense]
MSILLNKLLKENPAVAGFSLTFIKKYCIIIKDSIIYNDL